MELTVKDREAVIKLQEFEKNMDPKAYLFGWTWLDAKLYTATINKLLMLGLVDCTYRSHSSTNYMLTELGRAISLEETQSDVPVEIPAMLPEDLFADIVGYDNVKELLRESLQLEKPIHILLWGPPSISKSKFLLDIEQAAGSQALPLLGSATSQAGLWDLIVERRPKFILIDELEKLPLIDMAALLSLMEQGRIIRAKVGRKLDEKLDVRVIAAANKITKLPPELLSRFGKLHLDEYNTSEYVAVVRNVLAHQEGLDEDKAHEVALKLVGKTHDIRDAIRVGRLSKRVGVERAVELLLS